MKKFILKTTTILCTTIILLCSCFFINYTYADTITIDGVNINVDSHIEDSSGKWTEFVKDGVRFVADGWAKYNTDSNRLWVKTAATGILTLETLNDIVGLNKAYDDIKGWTLDGVEYGKSWLADGWDSLHQQVQDGTIDNHGAWLAKKLLGAVGTLDGVYSNVNQAINDIDRVVESAYKNYYDGVLTNTNTYATGGTKYYQVANNYTNTFYDTYNNTYETINNYNYDIYNNNYNYYTDNSLHYQVSNVYNNTYVFNVTSDYDYSLYYKLPNGSNSYNLTEENIYGIRTDLNVSNYEFNYYDNTHILDLYHFNGNLNSITNNEYLDNGLLFNGVNYVDSYNGFDLALLHVINNSPNISQTTKIEYAWVANDDGHFIRWDTGTTAGAHPTVSRSTVTFKSHFKTLGNLFSFENVEDIKNIRFMFYYDSYGPLAFTSSNNYNEEIIGSTTDLLQSYALPSGIPNVINIDKGWNFYEINYNGDTYDVYNNGLFIKSIPTLNNFKIVYNQACNYPYFLFDELYISDESNSNHDIKYIPYDNNFYYTLPSEDTNNKLLIQSPIAVNSFQFGGLRSVNAEEGDVYIYLNDNVISSIQQFNGIDWISVDGAIYNKYLDKWVNAIGFSILTNNWSYSDISANDVYDDSTMAKWLSGALNNLADGISKGFDNVINTLKDLLGLDIGNSESLINIDDSVDIDSSISGYLDDVKDIDEEIEFYLDDDIGDDLNDVKLLAQSTSGIFTAIEDNNMSILWIAPLIVLIVRLVI